MLPPRRKRIVTKKNIYKIKKRGKKRKKRVQKGANSLPKPILPGAGACCVM